jgi:hypothetical protein
VVASNLLRNAVKSPVIALLCVLGVFALPLTLYTWLQVRTPTSNVPVTFGIAGGVESDPVDVPAACTVDPDAPGSLRSAAWLRLATLSQSGQARLFAILEAVADAAEAETHPLGTDLEGESPAEILRKEATWFAPGWTAVRELLRPCFWNADATLVVITPTVTQPFERAATFAPFAPAGANASERQARFLSWPLSFATHLSSSTTHQTDVESLRARSESLSSPIAVVLDDVSLSGDPSRFPPSTISQLETLARRFERILQRVNSRDPALAAWREVLATKEPPRPMLSWLNLQPGELLLVPKLSFALDARALRRELHVRAVTPDD